MIQIYEWVNSLVAIDNELFELKLSIELNEKELSRWTNYIDTDGDLAKHQTFLTSLEKQNHLKGVIKEREEIIELIDKFSGLNQKILKLKYVEGLTLESIADETGYSYSYIKSKHAEIMRMVQFSKKV